ncbi:MAG: 5-formyltetrahydrofolate cyclo-ligase [Candidatus Peribacteraceae bacterium]|nr:5-formyltetrahydrofolate cyclo-ligase [Candidatus Peribacteraceae bacterium]
MIAEEKSRLRSEMLAKLKNFAEPERAKQNQALAEKLFVLPEFQDAKTITFFASEPFEVATDSMIEKSLESGKQVALPRVEKDSRDLEFHEIKNLTELQPGCFGINCPVPEAPKVPLAEIDLLVVPGLAFDLAGNRLGRGGGYFDRVLEKFSGVSVGLAFDFQIILDIPAEKFDQKVSKILTTAEIE